MAQTTASGGPTDPADYGSGVPDSPELWGANGLVGDGRYRLTYRLGRGGMAEVFAAEDVRLGRTVAVKLLRSDLSEDPTSKARFTREAQSVAGLNHHAVVAVYDSGEDRISRPGAAESTVSYIVMELVEGRTIRDLLIDADAPPVDQALIIVSGVLEALAYSHQHGIVHRDIKPANVIITNTGAVKVMDFGIARALHGAASTMTQTGMVMGTPQYLSPEQALGKTVDYRSDLYATGCMLYELLTLRPPFTGESPLAVVYQHVQDIPQVPSEVNDRVPPELDGLVLRALAKEPDDRFQSAEEMRGLVQYSLRMLQEQGGHTGSWDTGFVAHAGPATPSRGTGALPHPYADATAEFAAPHLAADGGDATVIGGGGYNNGNGHGGGRRNWLPILLLVIAAVLAVGGGIWIALDQTGSNTEETTDPTPSVTQSTETSPSATPSEDPTTEETQTSDGTITDPTYTNDPTYSRPSYTGEPTTEPTTTAPSTTPAPTTTEPTETTDPTDDGNGDPTDPVTILPTDAGGGTPAG